MLLAIQLPLLQQYKGTMKLDFSVMEDLDIAYILITTTHCNLNYNNTRWYKPITENIKTLVGKKYETEIKVLVTNISRALKVNCMGLRVQRDENKYHGKKPSYSKMIKLLDILEQNEFIDMYVGGWGQSTDKMYPSCILFKPKLTNLWNRQDITEMPIELPTTEIRDRDTKQDKSTKGCRGIKQMNEKLDQFNREILEHLISLDGHTIPSVMYKRVFVDNLTQGGRYYDAGASVQTLSQKVRAGIMIDGEETIELDMKANHPSFAYERAGIKMEDDFEPYDISEFYEIPCDWSIVEQHRLDIDNPKYDPVRNLTKFALLVCINSRDSRQALGAVALALGEDKQKPLHSRKYYGIGRVSSREICNGIINQNYMIEDVFYSDYGVIYQNVDSKIAELVVDDFLQDNEIVLIWHDSFRCKKSLEQKLNRAMHKAYKKVLGSDMNCRVEKK